MSARELPELVGEAQVVADEHRHPEAFDVDRDEFGAGPHVALLTGERERMDLAVAVLGAVGASQHEAVRRALIVGRRVGADLRARPTDPDTVLAGLVGEELRRRSTLGFGDQLGVAEAETGRERLGQQHQPGARVDGTGDHRREVLEVGGAIVPHDVVLHGCDAQRAHGASPASRSTAASITSSRLQQAKRTM